MTFSVGDTAPDFTLPACDGGAVTLSNLKGKRVVLYFYPKDDTPGCTKEALQFTELKEEFEKENTVIFGVSKDSVEKHVKFKEKFNLTVTLLADEACEVIKAYGVWVEKSMYGKKYFGIERATFVINADGKFEEIYRKVKVPDHAKKTLKDIRAKTAA